MAEARRRGLTGPTNFWSVEDIKATIQELVDEGSITRAEMASHPARHVVTRALERKELSRRRFHVGGDPGVVAQRVPRAEPDPGEADRGEQAASILQSNGTWQ